MNLTQSLSRDINDALDALRSNAVPLGENRLLVITSIAHAENLMDDLNRENIYSPGSELVQQQRDELSRFITLRKSLLAPIKTIPDELLCEIFLLVWKSDVEKGFTRVHEQYTFIRRLSRVSCHWRSAIEAYPLFWSVIELRFDKSTIASDEALGWDAVQSFVERCMLLSNEIPLIVHFGHSFINLQNDTAEILALNSYRWKSITIGWNTLRELVHRISKDTSHTSLKSLTLSRQTKSDVLDDIDFILAPALTRLELVGIWNPVGRLNNFPWSQITHFVSTHSYFIDSELEVLLESMPNLTTLQLLANESARGWVQSKTYITLPKLTNLIIRDPEALAAGVYIIAPKLYSLDMWIRSNDPTIKTRLFDIVLRIATRFTSSLRELTLRDVGLSERQWTTQFRHAGILGKVQRVNLYMKSSEPAFVKDLQYLNKNTAPPPMFLFPGMEELYLHISWVSDNGSVPVQEIIKMLNSRLPSADDTTNTITCLTRATVDFAMALGASDSKIIDDFLQSNKVRQSVVLVDINYTKQETPEGQ